MSGDGWCGLYECKRGGRVTVRCQNLSMNAQPEDKALHPRSSTINAQNNKKHMQLFVELTQLSEKWQTSHMLLVKSYLSKLAMDSEVQPSVITMAALR
ncbi:hypothetical protein CDAR_83881 [Caerostris darwini]|uniref:Uncharacterized protein n=1 Tax=Caerostris darwini TaxID=1538125 RepID=A0AAV4WZ43_9ARAC|nr:hypothetical protein CDAR_83881 [Caerostris darwini]